jgi:hypothetical protein
MPVIPALRRLKQEDHEFKANLGYIGSSRAAGLHSETLSQNTTNNKSVKSRKF